MRALEFAGVSPHVRGRVVSVLLVIAVAVALTYVAGALPLVDPTTPVAANLDASLATARSTQLEAPIAAAPADAPSRGPLLRVYLVQPVPYESGLPVFRGYVRNDHTSNLSNLRMEVTYSDGAVVTYPIVDALAPGEQISFEFRGRRPEQPTQPKFLFSMSRAFALIPRTSAAQVAAAAMHGAPGQVTTLLSETPWRATHFAVQPGTSVAWLPAIGSEGDNRLYRVDTDSGTVTDFALPNDRGGGWSVGVRFAPDGSLWLAWDQTLVRFDPVSAKSVRYDIPTASAFEVGSQKGTWVRDLAIGTDGVIWLSRQHATSLLRFDPAATTYTEIGLGGFGVPDQIRVDPAGKLWLTLARDPATMQELTRAAVFGPSSGATRVINEWTGGIAFDAQGSGLILGKAGVLRVDAAGVIVDRLPIPVLASAADLVTSAGGKIVITSKAANTVSIYDETTRLWTVQKLPTTMGRIFAPPGYTGPMEVEMSEHITDAHMVWSNRVLLLAPGSKSLHSVQL